MIKVKLYPNVSDRECELCHKPIFDDEWLVSTPDGIMHDDNCFGEYLEDQLNINYSTCSEYIERKGGRLL